MRAPNLFARDQGGAGAWGQVAKLTAAAEVDGFGRSVAISGDTVIVGAIGADDSDERIGSAYLFARDQGGAEAWGQVAKLTAADAAEDRFGWSVAISGDTVIVGAPFDDHAGERFGSAYLFARDRGGAGAWGQVAKLTAAAAAAVDGFGRSVAVSGDTVIVGSRLDDDTGGDSGSAYLFARDRGGAEAWGQVAKLTATDGAAGDEFGWSVALSGDAAIVGAPFDADAGDASGSAYLFARDQGGTEAWDQVAKLTAGDAAAGDAFGSSVVLSGDTVIVGATFDDHAGERSGSASVFQLVRADITDTPAEAEAPAAPEAPTRESTVPEAPAALPDTGSGGLADGDDGGGISPLAVAAAAAAVVVATAARTAARRRR